MHKGYILIKEDSVFLFPFNGEIWMTANQIAELFGVFTSAITSNIKVIFKNNVLDERQVQRTHSSADKIAYLYNLEMITALAYRLSGVKAALFREWVHKTLSFPEAFSSILFSRSMLN